MTAEALAIRLTPPRIIIATNTVTTVAAVSYTHLYVHRIGRTGRAGRSGRALLFVEPRERRLLRNIEHLMKKPINEVELPNHEVLQACRRKKFQDKITKQLEHHDLEMYRSFLLYTSPHKPRESYNTPRSK